MYLKKYIRRCDKNYAITCIVCPQNLQTLLLDNIYIMSQVFKDTLYSFALNCRG